MLDAKLVAAKAVGALARRSGRGGGTSLPGKLLSRWHPGVLGALGGRLRRGSVVVSATNGKTTTAGLAAAVLERGGGRLVHNRAGANMAGGVVSALVQAAGRGGAMRGELGLFEVDELWVAPVVEELEPHTLLLANLFRDQLDRYGELESIADRWAELVRGRAAGAQLVLNADDPLVADLGRDRSRVTYFGVQDDRLALSELQHASDSKHCRRCGHAYRYQAAYLAHLGHYRCPNCGQERPVPAVAAEDVQLRGVGGAAFTLRAPAGTARVELPLPGLYNVYNALAAAALCLELGVGLDDVRAGLEGASAAFGRAETVRVDGRELVILLVKNPAGANEVLRTLTLEEGEHDLLCALNDRTADGHDVSWVWDADHEVLAGRTRRAVCTGTRAAEMALRLKYAGVPADRLVVEPELPAALDRAVAEGDGPLYALPTYTALLELRDLLADRGHAERYWAP